MSAASSPVAGQTVAPAQSSAVSSAVCSGRVSARQQAAASRRAQGLPATVEDPVVLARVAALLISVHRLEEQVA
jgi:hypothetical protein